MENEVWEGERWNTRAILFFFFNCGKEIQTLNYLVENTPVTFKHWVMTLNIWIFGGGIDF